MLKIKFKFTKKLTLMRKFDKIALVNFISKLWPTTDYKLKVLLFAWGIFGRFSFGRRSFLLIYSNKFN